MEILLEWDKKIEKLDKMIKMQEIVLEGLKEEKTEYEDLREHEFNLIYGSKKENVSLLNNIMVKITGR